MSAFEIANLKYFSKIYSRNLLFFEVSLLKSDLDLDLENDLDHCL